MKVSKTLCGGSNPPLPANGRVLDTGTGRGLQNLDNVGSIPTSLSKFSNGSVDKLVIVTSLSRRNVRVQVPPELPFIGVWRSWLTHMSDTHASDGPNPSTPTIFS